MMRIGQAGGVFREFVDLVFDGLHDFPGIASAQHQHDAGDHFTFAVHHGSAMPNGMSDPDLGDIPNIHRRAAYLFHDDVFNIV